MIANVDSQQCAKNIANVFLNQNIAQVSSITLIPYLKETEILQMAYIDIEYWCDSEVAYNFLQRLKVPEGEARLVYATDDWWPVQINTHNNGQLLAGVYTTTFSYSYIEKNKMFEEEKIEYAVANSKNVTLRAHQSAYVM
jgi:hypothetical protein